MQKFTAKGGLIMASGYIRKRKRTNGFSYQVVVEASKPNPITGKRSRIYKTFNRKKDAEQALADIVHNLNHGSYADAQNMSVCTLLNEWFSSKEYGLKESTKARYRQQLDWYIIPKLGKYPLSSLNVGVIQKFINEIYISPPTIKNHGNSLSPKTVKNIFYNLKSALDYATELNLIVRNPCDHVNLPKINNPEIESYNEDEIQQILYCAKGTDLFFPIYLLINTGMRRGELLGLRWQDVHIDNEFKYPFIKVCQTRIDVSGHEVIDTPKSKNSRRTIFLSESAREQFLSYQVWCKKTLLKQGKTICPEDYVIIRSDGNIDSPDNFSKRWRNFLKKNKIKRLKLHCLRHTCATMLLKQNVDVKTISTRLGHADTTLVLNTYGHTLDSMSHEAAEKIDNVLNIS